MPQDEPAAAFGFGNEEACPIPVQRAFGGRNGCRGTADSSENAARSDVRGGAGAAIGYISNGVRGNACKLRLCKIYKNNVKSK